MSEHLTSKERPQFVPAVRKPKLPYLCAAAECVTCKRTVSGDWGLVPDECEICDAERQSRYYRAVSQWAEGEIDRLTADLRAEERGQDNLRREIVGLTARNAELVKENTALRWRITELAQAASTATNRADELKRALKESAT